MPEIEIEPRDQGGTFEVDPGDLIVIRLAENMSTGYSWEVQMVAGSVAELVDSAYSPTPGMRMGGGGTRTFRFRAKSRASGRIRLGLRRPWDPPDVAAERFEVNVKVR